MTRRKFTEEKIAMALWQAEAGSHGGEICGSLLDGRLTQERAAEALPTTAPSP